jgi:hypothetical protein
MTGTPSGLFFCIDGERYPITDMFDIDGEATADPEQATSVVALLHDGQWVGAVVRPGDIQKHQLD